ncbi:MAG: hypothetical protein AAGG07_00715 [Planctomycetota bacterium]
MRLLLQTAFSSLLRPGPPPTRWARPAIAVAIGFALFTAVLIERGWSIHENTGRYFGEGRPGTVAVVVLFVISGVFCLLAARDLGVYAGDRPGKRRFARFWRWFAVLLFYLAADDMFKVHENLDVMIASAAGLDDEKHWVDEIDSIIVALYLPLMVALAWPHRIRLAGTRWLVVCMSLAIVLFIGMVVIDISEGPVALEESLKLFAAVAIMLGVAAARDTYRDDFQLSGDQASGEPA